ncbi:MAG TPA: hypothetical protein VG936_09685 [Lacunisphaera sp.]|nr:hypothetical protein [Lacunisphaera sp.]
MSFGLLLRLGMTLALGAAVRSEAVSTTPDATAIAAQRYQVVVNDPANPTGLQIRRARRAGEEWPDYFTQVYLWPYRAEDYNQLFTTLNQNGRRVQFIAPSIFAVGDLWYLVLRGEKSTVEVMARNVSLDSGDRRLHLVPVRTDFRKCPTDESWLGLVAFPRPTPAPARIMSSFALFGNAGGVAEVLDEETARRRYAVLRDLAEIIERLYQQELQRNRR